MAEMMCEVVLGGLKPLDDGSRERLRAWGPGEIIRFKASKARNGQQHKRFFAMLRFVLFHWPASLGPPPPVEQLIVMLKYATGYVDWIRDPSTGEQRPQPKSMDFGSMDEPEFQEFWRACGKEAAARYLDVDDETFFHNLSLFA